MLSSVCVFCGSNPGADPRYKEAAMTLGAELAQRRIRLVYGGSHLGLMGTVANAALMHGGDVVGVVPHLLVEKEAAYKELSDLRIVHSMHERKALMVDLSDGFVALPGAYGTFDELFECLTWGQLHIHQKPVVVWNVGGYYDSLFEFLDKAVEAGFLKPQHRALLRQASSLEGVFLRLHEPVPAVEAKWMTPDIR